MNDSPLSKFVAIVDYGLGNLYSVQQACINAGLNAIITSSKVEISKAQAVIFPGVGAFGDAMDSLNRLDLIVFLRDIALSGKPFLGICLGMQLLLTESHEFGMHDGLNIVPGKVVRLTVPHVDQQTILKIPQVGWNRIVNSPTLHRESWSGTLLDGMQNGEYMYFVHSYYCIPADPSISLAVTHYGPVEFCVSFSYQNIFACQFHPERSGLQGQRIYSNLKLFLESGTYKSGGSL
jgi:imidazole glycerol-phosphate synthase subunit HisH